MALLGLPLAGPSDPPFFGESGRFLSDMPNTSTSLLEVPRGSGLAKAIWLNSAAHLHAPPGDARGAIPLSRRLAAKL